MLTLPVLPFVSWPSTWSLAGCLYWLAAIWLAIGWRRRSLLFAASSTHVGGGDRRGHHRMAEAAVLGRAEALPAICGIPTVSRLTGLRWASCRSCGSPPESPCAATRRPRSSSVRPVPTVDWLLRHALVAAQLLVVVVYLLPGVGKELIGALGVSASIQPMAAGGVRPRGMAAAGPYWRPC